MRERERLRAKSSARRPRSGSGCWLGEGWTEGPTFKLLSSCADESADTPHRDVSTQWTNRAGGHHVRTQRGASAVHRLVLVAVLDVDLGLSRAARGDEVDRAA